MHVTIPLAEIQDQIKVGGEELSTSVHSSASGLQTHALSCLTLQLPRLLQHDGLYSLVFAVAMRTTS